MTTNAELVEIMRHWLRHRDDLQELGHTDLIPNADAFIREHAKELADALELSDRKLQRALEVLRCIEDETAAAGDAAIYLDEIEAMQ